MSETNKGKHEPDSDALPSPSPLSMRPLRLATAFKNASLPSRVSPAKIRTGRLFSSLKRTQPLPVATVARLRDIRGRPGIPGSRHSFYSTQKVSFSDSGRSSLFYHLVGPPTPLSRTQPAFALSFLEKPPVDSDSSTITGWLPATSVDTALEGQEPGLNDFRENRTRVFAICSCCVELMYWNSCSQVSHSAARSYQERPRGTS
ncbi:hypothetical protein DXG01_010468 [Tephrocybe rancida]|nr:hypothetical protein DXG01_010468 [Tephrocybe rancida]